MTHNTHYNYSGDTGISGKHRARIERDTEFIKAYRRVLELMIERGVPDARRAAIEFTVAHVQPRYHVSYDRAYNVVTEIIAGRGNPVKPSLQAQMWEEIAQRVRQLITSKQISIARAVEFVLEHCRASRFFITPDYAYHHIRRIETITKPSRHEHLN
ncbi:MAG: hypothetical protein HUK11_10600 [Muribaculaceae bacterium]|nr:hypothetical protein [Muribaculaceae bacterium]